MESARGYYLVRTCRTLGSAHSDGWLHSRLLGDKSYVAEDVQETIKYIEENRSSNDQGIALHPIRLSVRGASVHVQSIGFSRLFHIHV